MTRMSFHAGTGLRQVGAHLLPNPVDDLRTRASGSPRAASAISVISSSSFCSRPKSWRALASVQRAGRGRRGCRHLGLFLGLKVVFGQGRPVVVVAHRAGKKLKLGRLGSPRPPSLPGPPPTGAGPCGGGPAACGRRLRSTTEAAVGARRSASPPRPASASVSPESRSSRSPRYWSSRAESRSSGASGGRPSMSICTTCRLRKAAQDLADVVLEPADHHVVEHPLA